jgi:hypothetical protein
MSAALIEATGAYQNWINAKSAGETGDMFDGTLEALKQIDDTLNNSDSDLFARIQLVESCMKLQHLMAKQAAVKRPSDKE